MAMTVLPFAIAYLVSVVVFTLIDRTARLSPGFSPVAAAVLSSPALVAAYDGAAASTYLLTASPPEQQVSLATLANVSVLTALTYAPTILILLPLLAFYLLRAFRKQPLLSANLVFAVGICFAVAQIVWLTALPDVLD
jgi:hypothetical protein